MAIIKLQGEEEKKKGIYFEVDPSDKPLGEGGMGKVYKGKSIDTKTGASRPVAIKFLFADLPEQAIERARREASVQLKNDNLIEMLGFVETDVVVKGEATKHYHVVSELLHGVSLSDIFEGKCADAEGNEVPAARKLLNELSNSPDHFAKTVMKAVLSGLMALHDAGYIHRDIDPSNIMVTDEGHIKLIDFGICKQMTNLTTNDQSLTVAGAFMGKPEYASPELALGDLKHQNQTTDIYAMGVLLYQCVLGHVPFEGPRHEVLDMQLKRKMPVQDIKYKELRRICEKATNKKQELRYQTSAEMRVDVESIDVKRAVDPRQRRRRMMFMALGVIVVLLAVVAIVFTQTGAEKQVAEEQAKHRTDSLIAVVNNGIKEADAAAAEGYKHDEGYDEQLLKAINIYKGVDNACKELPDDVDLPDYKAKKDTLISKIKEAQKELSDKAAILSSDLDPSVVAEAKAIKERADALAKAVK